jgi:hypothetical protein
MARPAAAVARPLDASRRSSEHLEGDLPSAHSSALDRSLCSRELKLVSSIDTLFQQAACQVEDCMCRMPEGVDRGRRKAPMRLGDIHSQSARVALKTTERAVQKTMRCYGGDCSQLHDI